MQWIVFAVLSITAMVTFRRRIYEFVRGRGGQVEERLTVGDRVLITARLEPGQIGRVEYRGSNWSARNAGDGPIEAGQEAVIDRVDGLTLYVKAE
jgi:inner membrane protein